MENKLKSTDTYNQKRVDAFISKMNKEVESYEKEIKLIEEKRDRAINMYHDLIRKEEAKIKVYNKKGDLWI